MLFTSKSRQINSGNANQKIVSVPNMFAQVRPRRNPAITNNITTITPSDGHKMTWGKPTWTFLHILPEKINDANFEIVKDSRWNNDGSYLTVIGIINYSVMALIQLEKGVVEHPDLAIDEAIEAKNSRINMVQEDENLSELIDKKRVKEIYS